MLNVFVAIPLPSRICRGEEIKMITRMEHKTSTVKIPPAVKAAYSIIENWHWSKVDVLSEANRKKERQVISTMKF